MRYIELNRSSSCMVKSKKNKVQESYWHTVRNYRCYRLIDIDQKQLYNSKCIKYRKSVKYSLYSLQNKLHII